MRYPIARRFFPPILLPCVLLLLTSCGSTPTVVEKPTTVEVLVPVVQDLPGELTRDCVPRCTSGEECPYRDPKKLTVRELVDRLGAVEDALAICRNDKALLRNLPTPGPPDPPE